MRNLWTVMLTAGLLMPSVSFGYLYQQDVIGDYSGTNTRGFRVTAKVRKSKSSTTDFPVVELVELRAADLYLSDHLTRENPSVKLGYDLRNNVYRGFISSDCSSPGCVDVELLEVKIFEAGNGAKLEFDLYTFVNPDGGMPGYKQTESGVLSPDPVPPVRVRFAKRSLFPKSVKKAINLNVNRDCAKTGRTYSTEDEKVTTENGETTYSASLAIKQDGILSERGYLSVANGERGSLEVVEIDCPIE